MFGMAKDKVKVYEKSKLKVKFKDVAGLDEAKVEISEFVDFLKTPERFSKVGAKMPRGALLYGPPGTGKTMLAKAAAKEANVQFITMAGSEFVEQYVGVGASRVRELFKAAKENSPCIIFIDEIDAVGKKRESRFGGNDEKDNTLNQLLVEMDGFGTDTNVVVLAATNRVDILDPALTRPGRFDRSIELTLPDLQARKEIFMVHLQNIKLDPSKTLEEYAKRLATLSPGFSGADIANLCNEAAILAARKGKTKVSSEEFEAASERVLAGLERKKLISEEERKIVAVHESGHAVVSWFLEGGHPLLKLTIIPRSKGSLGFAQYLPNESSLETKEELMDRICCILAGRCSEEVFNGKSTTGAYDDLQKAFELAKNMVTKFGMSQIIGHIGLEEDQYYKKYSEDTARNIDDEIKKILDECQQKTLKLCEEYKPKIKALSEALLEKETLDLQAIVQVLGERPFPPKSNFKAYLESKKLQDQEVEEQKKKEKEENEKEQSKPDEGVASA
jgi:AFG3 family protein